MNRRRLLELGAGGCAAGLAGLAAGYKFHDRIRAVARAAAKTPAPAATPKQRFKARADGIEERHRKQTKQDVQALKAKYEAPVLGKFRVWDLIEKLSLCIDPTDNLLGATSQYVHVCQILQVMEQDEVLDETMLLTALLHDIGKVALLAGEAPENVVCFTQPVEEREPEAGLDNVLFQFGHDDAHQGSRASPRSLAGALSQHARRQGREIHERPRP